MRVKWLPQRVCPAVLLTLAFLHTPGPAWGQPFEWQPAAPESQGMSSEKLDQLKASLVTRNTKALLVIRNDRVVYEWYADGHEAGKAHYTASMAKAVVGGVSLAVAVTDGRIALDDKAAKYVPQWKDDPGKSGRGPRWVTDHVGVSLPFWFLAIACGVLPVRRWNPRRVRRQRVAAGLCAACGYDLARRRGAARNAGGMRTEVRGQRSEVRDRG